MIPQIQSHPTAFIWDGQAGILDEDGKIILASDTGRALREDRSRPTIEDLFPDLWLKADAITGLNSGDVIDTWPDSSGNSHDAAYYEGGVPAQNHAVYTTGVLNGMPGVYLGVNAGMFTGYGRSQNQPFTVFAVVKLNDLTVANRRAVQGTTSPDNWLIGPYQGSWQLYAGNFVTGPAIDLNGHLLTAAQQTGDATFYVDNVLIGSTVPVAAANWPAVGIGIGNLASNEDLLGYICEVVCWSRILDAADLTRVTAYLRTKWAI